jgi:sporulation and spore germination protein
MRVGRANALTALGLLALLLVVVLAAPRWTRLLTRTVPGEDGADDSGAAGAAAAAAEGDPASVEQRINVKLFFMAPDQPALLIEDREVPYSADLARQVRTVVEELVKGPQKGLVGTLPAETKVIDTFVTSAGTAYVDFSKEAAQKHPGGSKGELLSVYSVVNSLTANFPAVKRVQILVDDRQVPTLAGHVDLTRPLSADMTFLVGSAPSPPAPRAEPASPAAGPPS